MKGPPHCSPRLPVVCSGAEDVGQDSTVTQDSTLAQGRPVIAVANRLPVQHGDNGWELSPGGLVTALRPVMAVHPGAWVGWDGGSKGMPATLPGSEVRLLPIGLSAAQARDY